MKKIVLILFLLVSQMFAFSQASLDKFEGKENVTSFIITKQMFEMMAQVGASAFDADTQAYSALLQKIDYMKFYTTSNRKITSEMQNAFGKCLKKEKMDELMKMNENNQATRIAVKMDSDGRNIKEMLLFSEGNSDWNPTLLMYLKGNFTLEDISSLTDKLPIPEIDDMNGGTNQKL